MSTTTEQTTSQGNPLSALSSLSLPNVGEYQRGGANALSFAQSFVIATPDDYELAAQELADVKSRQKRIDAARRSITDPLRAAADAVMKLFTPAVEVLAQAESAWKDKMLAYVNEQQRIQREQERLAREEQERQRQQREAEAAAARAEAERLAAEAAASGDAAAEDRAMEASAAAAQIAASANVISAPVAQASAPKVAGTSVRTTYDFEVQNLLALVQHVAANPHLIGLLRTDDIKLRAQVKATGANTNLPGVRVYEKTSLASRASKE